MKNYTRKIATFTKTHNADRRTLKKRIGDIDVTFHSTWKEAETAIAIRRAGTLIEKYSDIVNTAMQGQWGLTVNFLDTEEALGFSNPRWGSARIGFNRANFSESVFVHEFRHQIQKMKIGALGIKDVVLSRSAPLDFLLEFDANAAATHYAISGSQTTQSIYTINLAMFLEPVHNLI